MEFKVREAQPIAMKIGFYEDFLNLRTIGPNKAQNIMEWPTQPQSSCSLRCLVVFTVKTELKNH